VAFVHWRGGARRYGNASHSDPRNPVLGYNSVSKGFFFPGTWTHVLILAGILL